MGHIWWLPEVLTERTQVEREESQRSSRGEEEAWGRENLNNRIRNIVSSWVRNPCPFIKIARAWRVPEEEKWKRRGPHEETE